MGDDHQELAHAMAAFTLTYGQAGLARLQAEANRTGRSPSELMLTWARLTGAGES